MGKDCYLKASDVSMASDNGLVSGPKNCGKEDCCESFNIETVGMGNFYQEERLGDFFKVGNSQDGRNVYRQKNGDNYLFYLQAQVSWNTGMTGKRNGMKIPLWKLLVMEIILILILLLDLEVVQVVLFAIAVTFGQVSMTSNIAVLQIAITDMWKCPVQMGLLFVIAIRNE